MEFTQQDIDAFYLMALRYGFSLDGLDKEYRNRLLRKEKSSFTNK